MGDEIGGHPVSGHVHTTAQVKQIEDTENNRRLTFQVSCGSAFANIWSVPGPYAYRNQPHTCWLADLRGFSHHLVGWVLLLQQLIRRCHIWVERAHNGAVVFGVGCTNF